VRGILSCFLDFYLVGMEKNFLLKKNQKGMKSPKKRTAEKNKKTKKRKRKKHTKGRADFYNLVINMGF
jgi:hypothetical protein